MAATYKVIREWIDVLVAKGCDLSLEEYVTKFIVDKFPHTDVEMLSEMIELLSRPTINIELGYLDHFGVEGFGRKELKDMAAKYGDVYGTDYLVEYMDINPTRPPVPIYKLSAYMFRKVLIRQKIQDASAFKHDRLFNAIEACIYSFTEYRTSLRLDRELTTISELTQLLDDEHECASERSIGSEIEVEVDADLDSSYDPYDSEKEEELEARVAGAELSDDASSDEETLVIV